MYQWLVYIHVLGVFGFLLAHGAAVAVSFSLRRERELARIRAWLDLSRSVSLIASISLLVLLVAGVGAGFMGGWWGQGWIWTALGLLILMSVSMSLLGSGSFNRIRALVQKSDKEGDSMATSVVADDQLIILLDRTRPLLLTAIGAGGLALILWLMLFKPF